jgi:hypothetical protein
MSRDIMHVRETERACEKDSDQSVRQTETVYPWKTEPCRRDKTFFLKEKQRQIVLEKGRVNLTVGRQRRVSPCDGRRLCVYSTAADLTVCLLETENGLSVSETEGFCLWERPWHLFAERYEDSLSVIETDKAIGLQEKRRQPTCERRDQAVYDSYYFCGRDGVSLSAREMETFQ